MTSDEINFMNASVGGYRDLLVWQKGILLAKEIYRLTRDFPADEKWGLVSQMRRAAVSVPSNIAEGQARRTTKDFIQFISIAEGSVAELDTQLVLAYEFGYCDRETAAPICGYPRRVAQDAKLAAKEVNGKTLTVPRVGLRLVT